MRKKYQVFVSSTYCDLVEERRAVIEAIINLGHIPVGMEAFQAGNEEQWQVIRKLIDEVDYYVVIVAERYGSEKDGCSYTEMEYDYARQKNVPTAAFLLDKEMISQWRKEKAEFIDNPSKLSNFRKKCEGLMVNYWKNKDELALRCASSLVRMINDHPRDGWVRATGQSHGDLSKIDDLAKAINKGMASTSAKKLKEIYCDNWLFHSFSNWENERIKTGESSGNILLCETKIIDVNSRLIWERNSIGEGLWIGYIFPMGDGCIAVIESLEDNPSYLRFYIFFKEDVANNSCLYGAFIEYEDDYNKIRFRCCALERLRQSASATVEAKYAEDVNQSIINFLSRDNTVDFEKFITKSGGFIEAINIHVGKLRDRPSREGGGRG